MKEFSAASGHALDHADDPADETRIEVVGAAQMRTLALAHIVPSRTNPRQHFDPARLQELADSIKASGVHQPILVRPLPGSRVAETDRQVQYELVAGERRYRASKLAGQTTIPALIRPLTDEQVLEVQIVENLQRDDLTELEEAEGYERLMQHSALTAEAVGAKIGKSRSYVYARLKLLDLCTEAREALRKDEIDASRGLLIARIPDGKLQRKALAQATLKDYHGELYSVRDLQTWLQKNVMLRLEGAPFQITDARLCPDAGSCKTCPKRTGANPDLFADVDGADICTDPPCFEAKTAAHRARLVAQAEARGMRVIDGAEAKEIIHSRYNDRMEGYSRLDQRRNDTCDEAGKGATLRNLLGKSELVGTLRPVLIEHPWTKELIEAVPTAEAEALLLAKGAIQATSHAKDVEGEIEYLKGTIEQRVRRKSRGDIFQALVKAVHAAPAKDAHNLVSLGLARAWLMEQCDYVESEFMADALGITLDENHNDTEQLRLAAQRMPGEGIWKALAITLIIDDMHGTDETGTPLFDELGAAAGTDLVAVRRDTRAAIKAEVAEEIKKLKAELAPKPAKPPKAAKTAAPTDDASAPSAAGTLAIGRRVRVTTDDDKLRMKHNKYAGKEGTITAQDGKCWDVSFKGRTGGLASFEAGELEMVA